VRPALGAGKRPDGLHLRAVEAADMDFLRALYAQVRADEMAQVQWPDEAKRAFLGEQADLQHRHYVANYPGADLLVIESGTERIGRIYVYRTPSEIRLMDIALLEGWRNRGFGSGMLRDLMDEARASGSEITLHVEPNNPAQRLYERLGFRLIEHRGVYDFLGWKPPAPLS